MTETCSKCGAEATMLAPAPTPSGFELVCKECFNEGAKQAYVNRLKRDGAKDWFDQHVIDTLKAQEKWE